MHRLLVASKMGKTSDVMEHLKVHSIHLKAENCLIFTAQRPSDHISQPLLPYVNARGKTNSSGVAFAKVK